MEIPVELVQRVIVFICGSLFGGIVVGFLVGTVFGMYLFLGLQGFLDWLSRRKALKQDIKGGNLNA